MENYRMFASRHKGQLPMLDPLISSRINRDAKDSRSIIMPQSKLSMSPSGRSFTSRSPSQASIQPKQASTARAKNNSSMPPLNSDILLLKHPQIQQYADKYYAERSISPESMMAHDIQIGVGPTLGVGSSAVTGSVSGSATAKASHIPTHRQHKNTKSTTLLRAMDNSVKTIFQSQGKEARILKANEKKREKDMDLTELIKQIEKVEKSRASPMETKEEVKSITDDLNIRADI